MKKIMMILGMMTAMAAQAAPIAYECSNLETPTATNDSWGVTVYNDYIAFFDNDHDNLAKFEKELDNGGGSVHRVYRSVNPNDPFRFILEDHRGWQDEIKTKLYGELYLGKRQKPTIFECIKMDPKKAKAAIAEAIEYSRL